MRCRRNIYIDLGANWCNTLCLFRSLPEHSHATWHVYAFEATPLIASFLEKCANNLQHNLPLPHPPLPPTGSTNDLFNYAARHGCKGPSWMECIKQQIDAVTVQLNYSTVDDRTVADRLSQASHCHKKSKFVAIPRAIGTHANGLWLYGVHDIWQNVRGGALAENSGTRPPDAKKTWIKSVPLADWMIAAFTTDDFIVLKMDIEGAEQMIIPDLIQKGAMNLIDVWLWECHYNAKVHVQNFTKCHVLTDRLRQHGVPTIYREPYPFQADVCPREG